MEEERIGLIGRDSCCLQRDRERDRGIGGWIDGCPIYYVRISKI